MSGVQVTHESQTLSFSSFFRDTAFILGYECHGVNFHVWDEAMSSNMTRELSDWVKPESSGDKTYVGGTPDGISGLHFAGTKENILIDITDVIFFFSHHKRPTGIQRVVLELVGVIFDNDELYKKINFVAYSDQLSQFVLLDRFKVLYLLNHLRKEDIDTDLQGKLADMALNGNWGELDGKSIKWAEHKQAEFYILGAGWIRDNYSCISEAKEVAAIRINVLVYDLIPIRYKEYFERSAIDPFAYYIKALMHIADNFFAISRHAAQDLKNYMQEAGLPERDVVPIKLGTFETKSVDSSPDDELSYLCPFVLFVSTIEVRKNHLMLVKIWQELIAEGIDVPNLVFVGRMGWSVENLVRLLEQTDYLNGKVVMLEGITDSQLSQLYRSAKFVVYPSFCEGWGLPVTEAICEGAAVLASSSTSIPEAGGDAAKYLDPNDVGSWKQAIRQWILSKDPRAEIDFSTFEVPRWEVALLELFREREVTPTTIIHRPNIRRGVEYLFSATPVSPQAREAVKHNSVTYTDAARIDPEAFDIAFARKGSSWMVREEFGSWTRLKGVARLAINVDASSSDGGRRALCLNLRCVDELVGMTVRIVVNGGEPVVFQIPSPRFVLVVKEFDLTGPVDISMSLANHAKYVDVVVGKYGRPLGIGAGSLLLVDREDAATFAQIVLQMVPVGGRIVQV